MKKKVLVVLLSLLLSMPFLLVACKDDAEVSEDQPAEQKQSVEQEQPAQEQQPGGQNTKIHTEEYLSYETSKSVLLGLTRDLGRATNVKETAKEESEGYSRDRIFCKTGEGNSIIIYAGDNIYMDGDDDMFSEFYIWKANGEYYLAEHFSSGEEENKYYDTMTPEEYAEEYGDYFNAYYHFFDNADALLWDRDSIISGKKITNGSDVRYELEITATPADYNGDKFDISIVAEHGKVVSVKITETNSSAQKTWEQVVTIEYDIAALTVPSLDGYTEASQY